MDIEDQKLMALEGLHTWARGAIEQAKRLNDIQARFGEDNSIEVMRSFQRERYFFITAANRLRVHISWVKNLGFLDPSIFTEFVAYEDDIKVLRDINEHVIDYFEGSGRQQQEWWQETASGTADASATVGQRIGDRLDWNELAQVAARIVAKLPARHTSQQE